MEHKNQTHAWLQVEVEKQLKQFRLQVRLTAGRGCLGILGPSGCGKSMTLKAIAGIQQPDSGRIELGERVLYDSAHRINIRPQDRRVGYLFQNYALFPNMTVRQNIEIGLSHAMGKGSCRHRLDELVEQFQLTGLEQQYPRRLSGGQQQRAALARIFAYEPEVLLLDEPFSALDTFLREGMRMQLEQTLKQYDGVSVLVTHDRDEAYQLCDHLLLMSEGKVLTSGATRDVFSDPGSTEAARLTGCKNISRVEILGSHRVRALDWDNLELTVAGETDAEVTAIGIRAHDFEPLGESEAEACLGHSGSNLIPVSNPRITELPFEWYITFEQGIWWKTGKDIHSHDSAKIIPQWLRVEPKAILLLRG